MRLAIITVFFLFHLVAVHWQKQQNDRGYIVQVGDRVPAFSMTLLNGDTLHISELKGKVVVLQFTASWCSVCRKEMPHLEKEVWKRFKDKPFLLIGVDYDEPAEKVAAFKKQMKVTYPFALDPGGGIFSLFARKGAGVTRNVVINRQGKIIFLTRLYDVNELNEMVGVIDNQFNNTDR